VNRDEAKTILLLYRSGADATDPEIAEALALAKSDPELSRWLEEQQARQEALRGKFRQIPIPAGLKEQIISEQAAATRAAARREKVVGAAAVAAIAVSLLMLAWFFMPSRPGQPRLLANTLDNYRLQMVNLALSGYAMDMTANDPGQIQAFLANKQAPSSYTLPAGLKNTALIGCAVGRWQHSKASLICFRTGKPLAPGQQSDLWLFVINQAEVNDVPAITSPQYAKVRGLITATWTQNGQLYLLGTAGDEQTIKKYL
jgi:uncharacterized membrane protein YbaN (DUF454 family)